MLKKRFCPSCGASDFIRLPDGSLKCTYCESILSLNSSDSKIFENETIKGDMQNGLKFAIHTKLIVTGDMNKIHISTDLTNARHVGTLKISGDMNECTVIFLDGATYKIKGDLNTLK